ncbi:hypothetical protein CFE70_005855 [Pyrenophora teres f. teres 0-1]
MSPGKTISLGYAKTSRILAPLLQNLQNGPNSVDPLATRQGLLRDLHRRLSARGINLQQRFNVTFGPERSDPRVLQPIAPLTSDRRQDASITHGQRDELKDEMQYQARTDSNYQQTRPYYNYNRRAPKTEEEEKD